MKRIDDKLIRVWFTSKIQDASNPDNPNRYRMKEFQDPTEAFVWMVKNEDASEINFITGGQIELRPTVYSSR